MSSLQEIEHQPSVIYSLVGNGENVLQGEWPDRRYSQVQNLTLSYYPANGAACAQAMIYGGGGYVELVHDREGVEIALWLNKFGIDAYVVTHRLPGCLDENGDKFSFDIALQDGLKSMSFIAEKSPDLPLFHIGLSSGGHLAGVMACQLSPLKCLGAIIAYAPINANHSEYKYPPGKPDYPPIEKQAFYDAWPIGIADLPHGLPCVPLFLAYALNDNAVPIQHALNLMQAAQSHQLDVETHIFPDAPHGFALRDRQGTHQAWSMLAENWIKEKLNNK